MSVPIFTNYFLLDNDQVNKKAHTSTYQCLLDQQIPKLTELMGLSR